MHTIPVKLQREVTRRCLIVLTDEKRLLLYGMEAVVRQSRVSALVLHLGGLSTTALPQERGTVAAKQDNDPAGRTVAVDGLVVERHADVAFPSGRGFTQAAKSCSSGFRHYSAL